MIEVRAFKQPYRQHGITLFLDDIPKTPEQPYLTVESFKWRTVELYESDENLSPLTIKPEAAQKLMDDLWNCGLRPSEGTGSAGQLAAVQAHLKDFKTILFKKLGITQEK